MDVQGVKLAVVGWLAGSWPQLAVTLLIVTLNIAIDRFTAPRLRDSASRGEFKGLAAGKAIRAVRLLAALLSAFLLFLVWGIDLSTVLISATTVITLLGVALFANWSILSNITSYFVLLLHPAFSRGTFIRIIDADNYVEGYISDLLIFNTELRTEDNQTILYPNNLLLNRVVITNPSSRLDGVGKLKGKTDSEPAA